MKLPKPVIGWTLILVLVNMAGIAFTAFTHFPGWRYAIAYNNILAWVLVGISARAILKSHRKYLIAKKNLAAFERDLTQFQFFEKQVMESQIKINEAQALFDLQKVQDLMPRHTECGKRFLRELQIMAKKYPQNIKLTVEKADE